MQHTRPGPHARSNETLGPAAALVLRQISPALAGPVGGVSAATSDAATGLSVADASGTTTLLDDTVTTVASTGVADGGATMWLGAVHSSGEGRGVHDARTISGRSVVRIG